MKAYLDIETSFSGRLTVIGIYRPSLGFTQLIRPDIYPDELLDFLDGTQTMVTYNGLRFDIPVIEKELKLKLASRFQQADLMHGCWRHNLYGGLKRVEETLGIHRDLAGLSGLDAVKLWARYENEGDQNSLEVLLKYNKEDVMNLLILEEHLRLLGERAQG